MHLNTKVPKYLWLNIESHIKKFPKHNVTLISNEDVSNPRIPNLNFYKYIPGEKWKILEKLYQHERAFRGNFWLTSTARLFALEDYICRKDQEVLHLESDVVLSKDFPFKTFSSLHNKLAYPLISDPRGVASVLYIRSRHLANKLSDFIIEQARKDPKTTEMIILRNFFEENLNSIQLLPIGPSDQSAYRGLSNDLWSRMSDSFSRFDGCFDGVDIGQYFFGTDPRNRRGKALLRTDLVNGYADIVNWRIDYSQERQFVNIAKIDGSAISKVYSLHLPSKRKKLFNSCRQESQFKYFVSKSRKGPAKKIYFATLIDSAIKSIARRLAEITRK